MKKYPFALRGAALGGLLLALSAPAFAQVAPVPPLMNFQGRLAKPDGTPVPDGMYTVNLSLWDVADGGSVITDQLWTETETVAVTNGVFSAVLGKTTALTDSLFSNAVYLEIQVGADPALTPRQQLVTVAHAFKADVALSVPDGSITATQIAAGTITADKLAPGVGAGFTLPYSASASAASFLFSLTNTGGGGGASFSGATGNYSVYAKGGAYNGLYAETTASGGNGIVGVANSGTGAYGVYGISSAGIAVFGSSGTGYAGYFNNKVQVNAGLAVTGASSPYPASVGKGVFLENGGTVGNVYAFNYTNFTPLNLSLNSPGGNVGIGTATPQTKLDVNGGVTAHYVNIVGGSDVAEPYTIAPAADVKPLPGMVVVMDEAHIGQMKVATKAYDGTVGGIISGANGVNPGITLTQKGTVADGSMPVASVGRVWCWCDADANGPIVLGSLLTTSNTPGYAMRVTDFAQANGATIGKAMSPLKSGKGLVLVLVSLK